MPKGGGKHEFMTPKAIAKWLKSKGLGKQHLYCQMCRKQTRDDNGFKCHLTSEKHLARMREFEENPEKFIEQFSGEFERGMLAIIRNGFKNEWVEINQVYNDYIRMRNQTRLNGTRWITLTDFVVYLGQNNICKVEDRGVKGWFVQYVDKDANVMKLEKREKVHLDDEERNRLEIEKRVKLAQDAAAKDPKLIEAPTELDLEKKGEVKFSLTVAPKVMPKPVQMDATPEVSEDKEKERPKKIIKEKEVESKKRKENPSKLTPEQEEKKLKLEKQLKRKATWLAEDIVVKVIDKRVNEGKHYKEKGVVEKVTENGFVALVKLDSGTRTKFQQDQLETVIPQIGKKVRIVNGLYRGEVGTLTDINMNKFSVQVKIESGKDKGKLSWEEYEDVCKIPEK